MKPNAARVTLGPASGPSMVRSVHYLYADGTAGSELPLHHYRVDLTDGVLCGGDGALIFSAAWDDCADEEHRLTCCRADVPLLEYVNRTGQAVWVRNGLASFTLLAKGASVRLPFPPDAGAGPWQIPATPEEEVWHEQTLAAFWGLQSAPVESGEISWDRVYCYTEEAGRFWYFPRPESQEADSWWDAREAMDALLQPVRCNGNDPLWFAPERLETLRSLTIAWQGAQPAYSSAWRRPAFWMRGKPVTPEQAKEIIRRTDRYFSWESEKLGLGEYPPGFLPMHLFQCNWFFHNHFPAMYGWCRPDGRIGLDGITGTYPELEELLGDALQLVTVFPELDLVLLLWNCEETYAFEPGQLALHGMPTPEFGMRLHDRRIELLAPKTAWEVFCRYQARYGEDPVSYLSHYNETRGLRWVDLAYLQDCIRAYGGDPAAAAAWAEEKPVLTPQPKPDYDFAVERLRYQGLEEAVRALRADPAFSQTGGSL